MGILGSRGCGIDELAVICASGKARLNRARLTMGSLLQYETNVMGSPNPKKYDQRESSACTRSERESPCLIHEAS